MKRPLDLWALRLFMEVATTRNMTRAAERLGVTQSAVSQAIRRLETSLDTNLIVHGANPVMLTPAGVVLRQRASALLDEAGRLPDLLRKAAHTPNLVVRLGLVETFAATGGPALMQALAAGASQAVFLSGLSGGLIQALLARDVDAILTSDPWEDQDNLRRTKLWSEPFVLLTPRKMTIPECPTLATLGTTAPMIRFSARSHSGRLVDQHLRRVGVVVDRRIEVDGADGMIALVAGGVGWALAPLLALLQGQAYLAEINIAAVPSPSFTRRLTLLCRDDVDPALEQHIANAMAEVLKNVCWRQLQELAPDFARGICLTRPYHQSLSHEVTA